MNSKRKQKNKLKFWPVAILKLPFDLSAWKSSHSPKGKFAPPILWGTVVEEFRESLGMTDVPELDSIDRKGDSS